MIGLGAAALWELWQRMNELDQAAQQQRAHHPERQDKPGVGVRRRLKYSVGFW